MKLHSISCFSADIPAAGGSYVMSHGRDLSAFPATVDGTCSVGANNPSGEPANDVNDVNF